MSELNPESGETPPIPQGWSRSAWVQHLRKMADRCQENVPERAAELRRWADEHERDGYQAC